MLARQLLARLLAAVFIVAAGHCAATAQQPTTPAIIDGVSPAAIASALSKGRQFEAQQRWADALAHYEQSLRDYPDQPQLIERFDVARLHYSLHSRYADKSFTEALSTLTQDQALDLLSEMLLKIDTHYVTSPPWSRIAMRTVESLEIGLGDAEFQRNSGLRYDERQVAYLRGELRGLYRNTPIENRQQLYSFIQSTSQLAGQRIGLRPSVVALEATAVAAGVLDNYSAFLSADQLQEIFSQIEGNFVGLGVELKPGDGLLDVVHVIPGSPADRAGVLPGDQIIAIDGRACSDMTTDESDSLLTGPEGSMVQIVVQAVGGEPRTYTVRREHVDVPSLEGVRLVDRDYGVAYIKIPVFQKTTSADLETALWDLHRQGMRSLIIDLRGNPGGLLTSSVELADKFVAQGRIVSTRGRSAGEDFDYQAHRAGTWRVPLVVLIDENSASASEIFAAAIHDNGRGTLVGQRSFGKGSVQGIFPLGHAGIGVRLTTAHFFSPNSQPISKVGVQPDIPVQAANGATGETQTVGFRGVTTDGQVDAALAKAIETARSQMALRP